MNESNQEQRLIERARALLDAGTERLDPRTAARLRAARNQALQAAPRHGWRAVPAWLPASGFAVLTLAVWLSWHGALPPGAGVGQAGIEDADILVDAEGPDFYRDLDFYDWLSSDASAG